MFSFFFKVILIYLNSVLGTFTFPFIALLYKSCSNNKMETDTDSVIGEEPASGVAVSNPPVLS